ncbi:type VI secretion system ATPase TssH [Rhizobium halophytocola]|uniref:Type VI secretion system protein VasG n=1 Tax=Rhizobium halophytocola TaxID=735519 RepID=A0ABS4E6A2_9HYPH|nr:type VI secretion system ATPase TssH [Rhizobium halophytocola]MBP1853442.1 type VI secretion system protein VasG [Rhizobium halophytocola]
MPQIDVQRLIHRLQPALRVALEQAASVAAARPHDQVDIAHWLSVLARDDATAAAFSAVAIDPIMLQREAERALDDGRIGSGQDLTLSPNLIALCREAWLTATLQAGRQSVTPYDLIAALDQEVALRSLVRGLFPALKSLNRSLLDEKLAEDAEAVAEDGASAPAALASRGSTEEFLDLYTHDMTRDAAEGRIDPVIGRDAELRQMVDILTRRRQNNPILVGEAGVGKTAVAEALALEIHAGAVPDKLKSVRLLMLDLTLLQAGAGVKGEFERRLNGVIDAVKRSPEPIILFIDEAHGLIGAGGGQGQGDAANILKPALARGEVRTIAATTWSEYKRYFEKDAALTRRFQPIYVREPDEETAVRMLRGVADTFMKHHEVKILDEAIVAAVQLSVRFMPARQLPDKAVSLIDTAAASVSLARQTAPEQLVMLGKELEMLAVEAEWLQREPASEESAERKLALAAEQARLQREVDTLDERFQRELAALEAEDASAEDAGHAVPDVPAELAENVRPLRGENKLGRRRALPLTASGEERLIPRVVDRHVIAAIVSRWTGIPLGKLLTDQISAARALDVQLQERVIGQQDAIGRIADAMRAARAGLTDPRRPPAVFLLVGMSGTGKTETALSLADLLYGDNGQLTTINMSEFKEEHKVSMLLGSPPGYVGYGEGGVLTEAVRRRPFGVLLLDEIDKAHPGVQDIFYQVFDKGSLRDGEGRDVDFKNTTIFMTANTGSDLLATLAEDPDTMPTGEALEALLMPELQKQFKPAFLGRTVILPFMPLGKDALAKIVDIQLERIRERVLAAYGHEFHIDEAVRDALVARAAGSEIGARAIEIMIGRDLLPPLASYFLDRVAAGEKVTSVEVTLKDDHFVIAAFRDAATKKFPAVS